MTEAEALDRVLESFVSTLSICAALATHKLLDVPWWVIIAGSVVVTLWRFVRFLRAPRDAAKGEG